MDSDRKIVNIDVTSFKKAVTSFLLNLKFIFKPSYWVMNNRYSKEWDTKINELLDKYPMEHSHPFNDNYVDKAQIKLGNYKIWACNHPYASFTLKVGGEDVRPSRKTIERAGKIYQRSNLDFTQMMDGCPNVKYNREQLVKKVIQSVDN
jgi:hypothetical protein